MQLGTKLFGTQLKFYTLKIFVNNLDKIKLIEWSIVKELMCFEI